MWVARNWKGGDIVSKNPINLVYILKDYLKYWIFNYYEFAIKPLNQSMFWQKISIIISCNPTFTSRTKTLLQTRLFWLSSSVLFWRWKSLQPQVADPQELRQLNRSNQDPHQLNLQNPFLLLLIKNWKKLVRPHSFNNTWAIYITFLN